jgi:hypothetical protein
VLNNFYVAIRLALPTVALLGLLAVTTIHPTPHWLFIAWLVIVPGLGALALALVPLGRIATVEGEETKILPPS